MTWGYGIVAAGAGEIAEVDLDNLVFGMEFMFDSGKEDSC